MRRSSPSALAVFFAIALAPGTARAQAPPWWADRDIVPAPTANAGDNYRPANLGQAMNMATAAYAELSAVIPGGPSFALDSFFPPAPANIDPADAHKYYAPVNIGQLKAIARPFYDEIASLSTGWLADHYVDVGLTTLPTDPAEEPTVEDIWPNKYPWTGEATTDPVTGEVTAEANYAPANIGQLKLTFALDFASDGDSDGLPDLFEYFIIRELGYGQLADVGPGDDHDEDGLTNAQELAAIGDENQLPEDQNPVDHPVTHGPSLVGHWRLDEPAGGTTALDSSEYDRIGLASGSGALFDPAGGAVSGALEFGPGGGQLALPYSVFYKDSNPVATSTIALWVKTTQSGTTPILSARGAGDSLLLGIQSADGAIHVHTATATGGTTFAGSAGHGPINGGGWHHVAILREVGDSSTGTLEIFVDGVSRGAAQGLDLAEMAVLEGKLFAGADPLGGAPGVTFEGSLDEVRIYDRPLRAPEVRELAGDGETLGEGLDIDGDGLPDWWEREHFAGFQFTDGTSVPTPLYFSGDSDPDGDRFTNWLEYQMGSDPNVRANLVLDFHLDEASGATSAKNSADPALVNLVRNGDPFDPRTEGIAGGAARFVSDANTHIAVANGGGIGGLKSLAISAWVRVLSGNGDDIEVFSGSDATPQALRLAFEQGTGEYEVVYDHFGSSHNWTVPSEALEGEDLHHLILSITDDGEDDKIVFHLDGVTYPEQDTDAVAIPQLQEFLIGNHSASSSTTPSEYSIDEFRIYGGALSVEDIGLVAQRPEPTQRIWGGYSGGALTEKDSGLPPAGAAGGGSGGTTAVVETLKSATEGRFAQLAMRAGPNTTYEFHWSGGTDVADQLRDLNAISVYIDKVKGEFLNIEDSVFEVGHRTGILQGFDGDSLPSVGRINLDNYRQKIPQLNAALYRLRYLIWPSTPDLWVYSHDVTSDPGGSVSAHKDGTQDVIPDDISNENTALRHILEAEITGTDFFSDDISVRADRLDSLAVSHPHRLAVVERWLWTPYQFTDRLPGIGKGYVTRHASEAGSSGSIQIDSNSWTASLHNRSFAVSYETSLIGEKFLQYNGAILPLQGVGEQDQRLGGGTSYVSEEERIQIETCVVVDIGTAGLDRSFTPVLPSPGGAPLGSFTMGTGRHKLAIPLGVGVHGSDQEGALVITADRPPAALEYALPATDPATNGADSRPGHQQFSLGHHTSLQLAGNRADFEIEYATEFETGGTDSQAYPPFRTPEAGAGPPYLDHFGFATDHWAQAPIRQVRSRQLLLTIDYNGSDAHDHQYAIEFQWAGGDGASPSPPFRRLLVIDKDGLLSVRDARRNESVYAEAGTGNTREHQIWHRVASAAAGIGSLVRERAEYTGVGAGTAEEPVSPVHDHRITRGGTEIYDVKTTYLPGHNPFYPGALPAEINNNNARHTTFTYAALDPDPELPIDDPRVAGTDNYYPDPWPHQFRRLEEIDYDGDGWDLDTGDAAPEVEFFPAGHDLHDWDQPRLSRRKIAGQLAVEESSFSGNQLTTESKLGATVYSTRTETFHSLSRIGTDISGAGNNLPSGETVLVSDGPFAWSPSSIVQDGSPTVTLLYSGGEDGYDATVRQIAGGGETSVTFDSLGFVQRSSSSLHGVTTSAASITGRHASGAPRGYRKLGPGNEERFHRDEFGFIRSYTPRRAARPAQFKFNGYGEIEEQVRTVTGLDASGTRKTWEATTTYAIEPGGAFGPITRRSETRLDDGANTTLDETVETTDIYGELVSARYGNPAQRQLEIDVTGHDTPGRVVTQRVTQLGQANVEYVLTYGRGGFLTHSGGDSLPADVTRTLSLDAGRLRISESASGRTRNIFLDAAGRVVETQLPSAAAGQPNTNLVGWNVSYDPQGEGDTVTTVDPDGVTTTRSSARGVLDTIQPAGRPTIDLDFGAGGEGLQFDLSLGGRPIGTSSYSPETLRRTFAPLGDQDRGFSATTTVFGNKVGVAATGPDGLRASSRHEDGLFGAASVSRETKSLLAAAAAARHPDLSLSKLASTSAGVATDIDLRRVDGIPSAITTGTDVVTIFPEEQGGGSYDVTVARNGRSVIIEGTSVKGDYTVRGEAAIHHSVGVAINGANGTVDRTLATTSNSAATVFHEGAAGTPETKSYPGDPSPSISAAYTVAGRLTSIANQRGHQMLVTRAPAAEGLLPTGTAWTNVNGSYEDPGGTSLTWADGEIQTLGDIAGTRKLGRDAKRGNVESTTFTSGEFEGVTTIKKLDAAGQPAHLHVIWPVSGTGGGGTLPDPVTVIDEADPAGARQLKPDTGSQYIPTGGGAVQLQWNATASPSRWELAVAGGATAYRPESAPASSTDPTGEYFASEDGTGPPVAAVYIGAPAVGQSWIPEQIDVDNDLGVAKTTEGSRPASTTTGTDSPSWEYSYDHYIDPSDPKPEELLDRDRLSTLTMKDGSGEDVLRVELRYPDSDPANLGKLGHRKTVFLRQDGAGLATPTVLQHTVQYYASTGQTAFLDIQSQGQLTLPEYATGNQWAYSYTPGDANNAAAPPAGMLTTATLTGGGAASFSYGYNGTGVETSLPFNAALNRVQGGGYGYDADGNRTTAPGFTFHWDALNRLRAVKTGAPSPVLVAEYLYDSQGRRIQKRLFDAGGAHEKTVTFLYDDWNLVYERTETPGGNLLRERKFAWGLDLSETPQGAGGVGGLMLVTDTDPTGASPVTTHSFPVYDTAGNLIALVDAGTGTEGGNVVAQYAYDPFGNPVNDAGDADRQDDTPFRFSTKYLDEETGLYYYGYRYYDPTTGSWLSRDPLGEAGGLNLYGFVGNDPVNSYDYLGLDRRGTGGNDSSGAEIITWMLQSRESYSVAHGGTGFSGTAYRNVDQFEIPIGVREGDFIRINPLFAVNDGDVGRLVTEDDLDEVIGRYNLGSQFGFTDPGKHGLAAARFMTGALRGMATADGKGGFLKGASPSVGIRAGLGDDIDDILDIEGQQQLQLGEAEPGRITAGARTVAAGVSKEVVVAVGGGWLISRIVTGLRAGQLTIRAAPGSGAVFRGTTRGYPGGGSGVTFTSTDPGVATVFAVQKRGLGTPVIEIARKADLAHVPRLPSTSPSLARIEAEIIFDISPTEFSRLATQVPLDDAVRALNGMGVRVPSNVPLSDVSSVLRELQKLNQTQIDEFLRAVAQ